MKAEWKVYGQIGGEGVWAIARGDSSRTANSICSILYNI